MKTRKKIKYLNVLFILTFFVIMFTNSYANSDFWGAASSWFSESSSAKGIEEIGGVTKVLNEFLNMINILGTTVIVCVTIILGVKFMFGTVEGKSSAKEGLVTLLVACMFFFGWTSLKNILYPGNNFVLFSSNDATIEAPLGRAFAYVKFFANIFAFVAIVALGIKYIFASSQGKADMKSNSAQFLIGLIMTFATINFLSFISDSINQALQ